VLLFMVLAVVVAVAIAALVAAARRQEEERVAAIRTAAARMGWSFRPDVEFDALPDLKRFELFRQGHSRNLRNLMTSPPGSIRAVTFEFSYVVSSGKSSSTHTQTVFYATGDELQVPSFSLRPEHFLHRVAAMFGFHDINFDDRPEFSRRFLLRGEDADAVRHAFTHPVTEFFEAHPACCAAGTGHELLFWEPGKRMDPDELETFVAEGYDLASRMAGTPRPAMGG
jgi:carbonic anhydrase